MPVKEALADRAAPPRSSADAVRSSTGMDAAVRPSPPAGEGWKARETNDTTGSPAFRFERLVARTRFHTFWQSVLLALGDAPLIREADRVAVRAHKLGSLTPELDPRRVRDDDGLILDRSYSASTSSTWK
jgi:hypothetical protein